MKMLTSPASSGGGARLLRPFAQESLNYSRSVVWLKPRSAAPRFGEKSSATLLFATTTQGQCGCAISRRAAIAGSTPRAIATTCGSLCRITLRSDNPTNESKTMENTIKIDKWQVGLLTTAEEYDPLMDQDIEDIGIATHEHALLLIFPDRESLKKVTNE